MKILLISLFLIIYFIYIALLWKYVLITLMQEKLGLIPLIQTCECIVNHSTESFCHSIVNSSKISCNYRAGIDR